MSEDYATSKVHHELLCRLCNLGIDVTVFTVVRLADRKFDIRHTYSSIDYKVFSYQLTPNLEYAYKLLFGFKKNLKFAKLIENINPADIDFVHAATLFSEGVIAYELFKKHGIPYSVAVRGTDIDLYLSKMPHLWKLGNEILRNASKIIFITPIIKRRFFSKRAISKIAPKIENKCVVIANGIEDYWLNNRRNKPYVSVPSEILYIGRFDKNKNVEALVKAILELKESYPQIKLNMVGGGDSEHDLMMVYCKNHPGVINYLGKIYDKNLLSAVIRNNHIFAMVSHSETFGLVFLEALSQGLPILYTEGQGIDSSVPDYVGEKAKSKDQSDITDKLRRLIENYPNYQPLGSDLLDFSWDRIASKYSNIFNQISN